MARRMRQEAGTDLGPSQVAALATIERHGPLSPSESPSSSASSARPRPRILRHLEEAAWSRVKDPRTAVARSSASPPPGAPHLKRLRARKTACIWRAGLTASGRGPRTLERAAELLEGMLE
jgi:hypothetical protein